MSVCVAQREKDDALFGGGLNKEMICVFLFFFLIQQLSSVPFSLPTPENLYMDSQNFHYLLRWDPGPGTPSGTQYQVFGSINPKKWKTLGNSSTTSLKLKLNPNKTYNLAVQAIYNNSISNKSKSVTFMPLTDTRIGPAVVKMSGCGNCLRVNVSLPEPDKNSKVSDVYVLYDPTFRVLWKKQGGAQDVYETNERSFKLPNLEKGVEYCVLVDTQIRVNKNTEPSTWSCAFTSTLQPSTVPVFLGAGAGLLILVFSVVMVVLVALYYSGFLCKLKANLPRALLAALSGGYTLTPEIPVFDHISVSSEKHNRLHVLTTQQPAARGEEEEEEEEEEGEKEYLNRGAELPPADRSFPNSASGDSGRSTESTKSEAMDTQGGIHQDKDEEEEEEEEVSDTPEEGQTGLGDHVTKESEEKEVEKEKEETENEEEVCDNSGNINLFSVKLSTLAVSEEEEEEEEEDKNKEGEEEDSRDFLTHLTETHTLDSSEEEEEEEEEEEFSGYMRHS